MKWLLGAIAGVVVLSLPGMFLVFIVTIGGEEYERQYTQNALCLSPVAQTATSGFRLPLVGRYTISSGYGVRVHPVSHETAFHRGLDLAMSPHYGPVVSMGAGTVSSLSSGGNGGNIVVVDHGDGLVSKYMHLSRFTVTKGQQVGPGTQLGVEGATGRVTGAHLHWEVWVNGASTDPAQWAKEHGLDLTGNAPAVSAAAVLTATQNVSATTTSTASAPTTGAALPTSAAGLPTTAAGLPTTAAGLPTSVGRWNADQLRNAAQIITAGRDLGLDSWSISVGVMVAMGESSLLNVDRGDAAGPDSRGLFQQRGNGAWGSYNDRMNPRIAATSFFKALQRVKGYHDLAPTIAGHRVQRNANPYHYAPFWSDAVTVVNALGAIQGLLTTLQGDGAGVSCADVIAEQAGDTGSAGLPAAPADCQPTGRTAERGLRPAALRGLRCAVAAFPKITTIYGVGERKANATSDHPAGNAVDFMIDNYRSAEGKAYGWQLATWTRDNAAALGVRYVIFDMKIWYADRPGKGWQPYTKYGSNPNDTLGHRNHVHVSYQRG